MLLVFEGFDTSDKLKLKIGRKIEREMFGIVSIFPKEFQFFWQVSGLSIVIS